MKKAFLVLLFVLISVSLFAWDFLEEFKHRESYVPDNILIYTGNDLFNYGISRNDDDQLSYSFDFKVEAPLWYARFNANGITNRGWRDGWDMTDYSTPYTPGAEVERGRYDSLETVLGLKLRPIEDVFYLHLYPEFGFALVGDYGWEIGQNGVHKLANIHEVELPYDNDGARNVYMMLDGRVNMGFKLGSLDRSNFIVEVEGSTKNILGFQSENQILGRVSVSTLTHDLLGLHFGYMYATALCEDPSYTQDLYLRYLNGLRVGFTVDTGLLSIKYTATPQTGYGYGYFGINVMSFFAPKEWKESNVHFRMSFARMYDQNYHYLTLSAPTHGNFEFIMKNSFLGGNPISKKEESVADLTKEERYKREYSSVALGVRYNLPKFLNQYVTPYVEFAAGLQVYKIFILTNQLADGYMGIWDTPSTLLPFDNYFALLNLEGGFTILPEELLRFQYSSLQIEVYGGVNLVLGGSSDEIITFYRYLHKFWNDDYGNYVERGFWNRFIPYFGVGVKIGVDL